MDSVTHVATGLLLSQFCQFPSPWVAALAALAFSVLNDLEYLLRFWDTPLPHSIWAWTNLSGGAILFMLMVWVTFAAAISAMMISFRQRLTDRRRVE